MNIFITGGTGFIGKQILSRASVHHRILVLVRSMEKFHSLIKQLKLAHSAHLVPVLGDLSKPQLGLGEESLEQVLESDIMVHAGGPMNIELDEVEAERVFLQASKEMAALAQRIHETKGLKHFIHLVGFMSPYHDHNFTDAIIDEQLEQAPPYERMKFKADAVIRRALQPAGIPLSVVNPAVVVGDSHTGSTEQLGGLSILVDAMRRGLMPVVPGGERYWLPMVHVDQVAASVIQLIEGENPVSWTYYLLEEKKNSPNIRELTGAIAKELRIQAPAVSVPLNLLKGALRSGLGKLIHIPGESMEFIVKSDFTGPSGGEDASKPKLPIALQPPVLPFVFADLDYRLSHGSAPVPDGYTAFRKGNLAGLMRSGEGVPVLLIHGSFSGADCFVPLADALRPYPMWLPDLPGFGRSPYHHHPQTLQGYIDTLKEFIMEFDGPVILAGHSFGGLLAAKVAEALPDRIHKLILLQPVVGHAASSYRYPLLTRFYLRFMTKSALVRKLLSGGSFAQKKEIPGSYLDYVLHDMKSPRVRITTAEVMRLLTEDVSLEPEHLAPDQVHIFWGEKDRSYPKPKLSSRLPITVLPQGHQFPLSHPEATADLIRSLL